MYTIALDAMGGDFGCSVVVPAALDVLKSRQDVKIILVGDRAQIEQELQKHRAQLSDNLIIHHTTEVVAMDEPPAQALRFKKDSSMRVSINLVKEGTAQACVSAGNTGALMATAKFVLKTVPGIERPAISALIPTILPNRAIRILDLGANVDCTPEQLYQFGIMGSIIASSVNQIDRPKVALLNIGSEEIKGNEQIKQATEIFSQSNAINYVGFIEGNDLYNGVIDVVVCDGFVGNVALKASEGLAKYIFHDLKVAFNKNWLTKLVGLIAYPILKGIKRHFDPAKYNGASLAGLKGIVIKSHGGASIRGFTNAILQALAEAKNNVPERISSEISKFLQQGTTE